MYIKTMPLPRNVSCEHDCRVYVKPVCQNTAVKVMLVRFNHFCRFINRDSARHAVTHVRVGEKFVVNPCSFGS